MEQVRLAFIGCGGHASNLLGEIGRIPEIDLVSVCDVQEERARTAARRFGALTWYIDFQKMLDTEKPDAVAVVGPPRMECQVAPAVLDQGYHLYVEKPLGRNSLEAQPLLEAARRSSKATQVGFMSRHARAMRLGKSIVESTEFGSPTYMEARHWIPGQLHPVWDIANSHYAYLMLHGIHAVDLLRFVFGEVDEVYTRLSQADDAGSLVSLCQFTNGANGILNLHSSGTGTELRYDAVGSRGRAVRVGFDGVAYGSNDHWAPDVFGEAGQFTHLSYGVDRGDRMGYRTEFQDFARALLTGEMPYPSIEDGFQSTRLAEAIFASALTGKPIHVADAPAIEL